MKREKIRKLQESCYSDAEVRERMREYYRRPDPDWIDFLSMVENKDENLIRKNSSNLYANILEYLCSYSNYGRKHRQIARDIGKERVVPQLKKLCNVGFIRYD